MYTPRPPPGGRRNKKGGQPPKPPGSSRRQPPRPSRRFSEDEDDFDHRRERKVVRGVKNSKRKSKVDEELGFLSDERIINKAQHGDHFDTERDRVKLKQFQTKGEVPTLANNYLGRRASEILRGDDPDYVDIDELLYNPDHETYEEQVPTSLMGTLVLVYHRKMSEKKMVPRALLCALAVALLWASSVSACRLVIGAVFPAPTYAEVESSVFFMEETVLDLGQDYENCVGLAFQTCNSSYILSRDNEEARLLSVQESNLQILDEHSQTQVDCSQDYQAMLEKLNEFTAVGLNFFEPQFALANPQINCQGLEAIAEDQLQALRAVEAAATAGEAAENAIQSFQDQLQERVDYDQRYHANITREFQERAERLRDNLFGEDGLNNLTEGALLQLEACFSGEIVVNNNTGEEVVCNQQALLSFTRELLAEYEADYRNLENQAQNYIDTVNGFVDDIERIRALADRIPDGLLDGLLDFENPDLTGIQVNFFNGLDGLGLSEDLYEFLVDEAVENFDQNLTAALEALRNLTDDIALRQDEFFNNLEVNFTPPGVDVELDISAEQAKRNAAELANAIEQSLGAIGFDVDDVPNISAVASQAQETAVNLLNGIAERDFEVFTYDPDIFVELEFTLDFAISFGLAFDTFWRILQSLLMIKKYWNISAISTPPADVRSDKGKLFRAKSGPLTMVADIFYSPILAMIYILLVVFVLSLLFYVAYIPLFEEFIEGCIDNNANDIEEGRSDGTMIFRNLETVAFSIAAAQGDLEVSRLVDALNLERQIACREFFEASNIERNDQSITFENLKLEMDVLNERYQLFEGCIDWELFDAAAANENGVTPLPFTFNDGFAQQKCLNEIRPIDVSDNALFDCDVIPACDVSGECEGPDAITMRNTAHNVACEGEYALHSYFLSGLFITVMFLCLNRARLYFLNGILEFFWPTICLDIHSYLVSCTERGTLLHPKEVEQGTPYKVVIKKALDKSLNKFTRKGAIDIGFAVSINLPWIIFMIVIVNSIDYDRLNF